MTLEDTAVWIPWLYKVFLVSSMPSVQVYTLSIDFSRLWVLGWTVVCSKLCFCLNILYSWKFPFKCFVTLFCLSFVRFILYWSCQFSFDMHTGLLKNVCYCYTRNKMDMTFSPFMCPSDSVILSLVICEVIISLAPCKVYKRFLALNVNPQAYIFLWNVIITEVFGIFSSKVLTWRPLCFSGQWLSFRIFSLGNKFDILDIHCCSWLLSVFLITRMVVYASMCCISLKYLLQPVIALFISTVYNWRVFTVLAVGHINITLKLMPSFQCFSKPIVNQYTSIWMNVPSISDCPL